MTSQPTQRKVEKEAERQAAIAGRVRPDYLDRWVASVLVNPPCQCTSSADCDGRCGFDPRTI